MKEKANSQRNLLFLLISMTGQPGPIRNKKKVIKTFFRSLQIIFKNLPDSVISELESISLQKSKKS
jgi:hypothetical protein